MVVPKHLPSADLQKPNLCVTLMTYLQAFTESAFLVCLFLLGVAAWVTVYKSKNPLLVVVSAFP